MKRFLQGLFAFAVFVGVATVFFDGCLSLAHKVLELQPVVAAACVAAVIAPIGSVTSLAVGRYYERKKTVEQDIRAKKTAAYEGLLDVWTLMFMGEKMGKGPSDAAGNLTHEFMQRTIEVHRNLVIWSNQEVLRRWSRLRRASIQENAQRSPAQYFADLELLLRAIREDIGHSNTQLAAGDIVGLFINEIPVPAEPEAPRKSIARAAVDSVTNKET
jgi:hypothetical protein